MKKFLSFMLVVMLILSFSVAAFADDEESHTHRINVTWLFDGDWSSQSQPPFDGMTVIGSTTYSAAAGDVIDIADWKDHPAGASYIDTSTIMYNGIKCYLSMTYAAGAKGINPTTGEAIDGYPMDVDVFSTMTMPDTDVDLYYIFITFYDAPEIPEDSLDKIVIYVNRPNGDINPTKQEYRAYEIFHVSKAPTVEEDVDISS